MARYRIGIDVGGTFTDLFLREETSGVTARHKLLSTPAEPHLAPLQGIREILAKVDFVSVGSNDLLQFLFAVDRGNARVAGRFDTLSPAFLRSLGHIAERAREAGKPVTLCGEMGSKPLEALTLIGLGYRSLSMSPASIGPVKAALLEADAAELARFIKPLVARADGVGSLRAEIEAFAVERGMQVAP